MGYAGIPTLDEGDKAIAHLGSWTYVVPSGSTKQDAAWVFMQWALSEPVQKALAKGGGLPALTSSFEDTDARQHAPVLEAGAREPQRVEEPAPDPGVGRPLGHPPEADLGRDLRSGEPADAFKEADDQLRAVLPLPIRYQ